jgi:hypothetical protein
MDSSGCACHEKLGPKHLLSIQSRLSLDPSQSCIYLSARVFQSVLTPLRYVTHHERTTTRAEIYGCCVVVIVATRPKISICAEPLASLTCSNWML